MKLVCFPRLRDCNVHVVKNCRFSKTGNFRNDLANDDTVYNDANEHGHHSVDDH